MLVVLALVELGLGFSLAITSLHVFNGSLYALAFSIGACSFTLVQNILLFVAHILLLFVREFVVMVLVGLVVMFVL